MTPRGAALAARGYAVLRGFLAPEALAAVRGAVDAAVRRPAVAGCERPHNELIPLRWDDPTVDLILGAAERRRAIAAATGGDDVRWISGYVSVKPAHSAPLWWHQDWWCWDHPVSFLAGAPQVALLCYLSATDERHGALRVLPGTHRRSVALHALLPEAHAGGDRLPPDHAALCDQPGQVTVAAQVGDAVLLDYRVLHGTHPNAAAGCRDCVLLSFTPSWRAYRRTCAPTWPGTSPSPAPPSDLPRPVARRGAAAVRGAAGRPRAQPHSPRAVLGRRLTAAWVARPRSRAT